VFFCNPFLFLFLSKHFFHEFYVAKMKALKERHKNRMELEKSIESSSLSAQMADLKRQELELTETAELRRRRKRIRVSDFTVLKMIGKGGYGEVYLVRKKDSSELLALKRISKEFILSSEKEVAHIRTERNVLAIQQSPWLVQMAYSFQDANFVYMAMEYAPGGDLRTLLSNNCPFAEVEAKHYCAEMFCSVDALHKEGYIHRDLKPENFLLDREGHIKLTDFGLSKGNMATVDSATLKGSISLRGVGSSRTVQDCKKLFGQQRAGPRTKLAFSLVGSPDYMAFEMLTGDGYDYTVDYWALACILFEMLTGFPPFAGEGVEDVFANVYNWEQTLNYGDIDSFMSQECWTFIRAVLCERAKRLGRNNFNEIKTNSFFKDVKWANLHERKTAFVPKLDGELDTKYFDPYDPQGMCLPDAAAPAGAGPKPQAFSVFTYKRIL